VRLALHIFKKDVRRFWWGIAIAILLQVAVDWMDVGKNKVVLPIPLDWLLLAAWAALIALAVHEDPLVGDRQFWITRPARWRVLLGSKLLFAVTVVHLPSFLADVAVLAARGFRPWEWFGSMFLKQIGLFAVITLPAIGLAAVLRNFAHLALTVIAIAGLAVFASTIAIGPDDEVRTVLTAAILGAGGLAVTWWQFARRRTSRTRLAGFAAVTAAELVFAFMTPVFLARVHAAVDPASTRISFQVGDLSVIRKEPFGSLRVYQNSMGYVPMDIPLVVAGIPSGVQAMFDAAPIDVIAPDGEHFEARASSVARELIILQIPPRFCERFRDAKVDVKGPLTVVLSRLGSSTSLRLGETRAVPGMGRCSGRFIALPEFASGESHGLTSVECESPASPTLPGLAEFRSAADLSHRSALFQWQSAGLAPLAGAAASFPLGPGEDPRKSGKFEITPQISLGWQVVDLDFRGLRLGDYIPKQR